MSYRGISPALIGDLGSIIPDVAEKEGRAGQTMGVQRHFTVAIGPETLADSSTYQGVLFIAPCDGCYVKELWVSAVTPIVGGTNTLNVTRYDVDAGVSKGLLSTSSYDPTSVTAKTGTKLTLTSTKMNLLLNEGDVVYYSLVTGLQTTAGHGYGITAIIVVPEIL